MATEHVKIEGLKSLQRDLKQAEKDLATELRKVIKGAANTVADKAKEIARSQGLVDSGDLVASIKGGLKGGAGIVKVTAEREGFRYPSVYEYGRRSPWQDAQGIRTFLEPALDAERAGIEEDVLRAMEHIVDELGHRGTE